MLASKSWPRNSTALKSSGTAASSTSATARDGPRSTADFGYALAELQVETLQPAKAPCRSRKPGTDRISTGPIRSRCGAALLPLSWLDHAAPSPEGKEQQ